ncbi:MFS transporter [Nocardia cyriacigeorgica]|uniref:MFS transporter n=1 Tax=Nocardia cyriacigeorgica TaxID=135487 RepID=UPI001895A956|nr:MFS transporter [Nocardia cyriacigeorgica]MBF6288538.1 MFS transporter [Nocardia cyriacigeorgica]
MTASSKALPREIWVLVGAAFVIAIGFGLVSPVLPQYARSFGVGFAAASAIVSAFALMRLLFAPMSGRLVQKLGERWVYTSGLLIVAVSTGASAFAQTYWQLLVLRSAGGIGSTMFTVSSLALLIRMSPPDQRGRISGLWSTSFLIGSLAGPLIGGMLAEFGLRAPFLIYAIALLIACGVVYVNLRDSHLAAPETADTAPPSMSFRDGLARSEYRAVLWSNFANGAAVFGVRMALVPLLVVEVLEQPAGMAGVALTVFAAGNAVVLFFSGQLSDRFGRKPFLIIGTTVCAIGTAGLGIAPNLIWLLVSSFVAGLGSGMFTPAQQAAVADIIGPKVRGGPVLAGFQMSADLGAVLGPIAVGFIAERLNFGVGLIVTGGLLAVAAVAWLVVPEPMRRGEVRMDKRIETVDEEADQLAAPCTCDGGPGGGVAANSVEQVVHADGEAKGRR